MLSRSPSNATPLPVASHVSFTLLSMEPLSSVASVLAITGAANVVLRSIERLRTLIRAPEAVDALIYEVQALKALLRDAGEAQELLKQASPSVEQLGNY